MCKLIEKEIMIFNDPKSVEYRAQMREIAALMEQKEYALFCLQKKLNEITAIYRKYIGVAKEVKDENVKTK